MQETKHSCVECQGTAGNKDEQIKSLADQIRFLTEEFSKHLKADPSEVKSRSRAKDIAAQLERIIGGVRVEPGGFSECCLIGNTSGGGYLTSWFCTGTLIHTRIVLTAKHCISQTSGQVDPNSIAIGVERERDVKPTNIHRVLRIFNHPTEDVSMLVLQTSPTIKPVALAAAAETAQADRVHLVGFGNTNPAGSIGFGTKREVNVKMDVVREKDTENLDPQEGVLGFNSFTEFVAGKKGTGRDSCNGDSGGPAYVYVDSKRKLAGVTSRATDEADDNCGDGGVYVRVDAISEWIDNAISSLS